MDYSEAYPQREPGSIGEVRYARLKSGEITVDRKEVPTAGLSSYAMAREIAGILRDWIQKGEFLLTECVQSLPSLDSGIVFKGLQEKPFKAENRV